MTLPRNLTSDQQAAVAAQDPICLVLAPAGSGKTEVLIQRVVRLLDETPGESHRILAVTFTLKAAEELRERVKRDIGDDVWRVTANTIHGFALDWLLRYGASVGVPPDAVVFAQEVDRLDLLQAAVEDSPGSVPDEAQLRATLREIDSVRTDRLDRSELGNRLPGIDLPLAEVLDAYEAALREVDGIDFPGMLDLFITLLESDPSVAGRFQRTYGHLLVDEGQDLTRAQADLLALLVGDDVDLFVVADDRQSIHRWAGGGIQWARRLVGETARVLHLRHNFRCATDILDAAQKIGQHFDPPRDDAEAPPGSPTGSIEVVATPDEASEADRVVDWIESLLDEGFDPEILVEEESPQMAAEESAVIARTRFALDAVVNEFTRRGRTVSMQIETSALLATPEARTVHALLDLRANPRNRPALRTVTEELSRLIPEAFDAGEVELATVADSDAVTEIMSGTPLERIARLVLDVPDASDSLDALLRSLAELEVDAAGWEEDVARLLEWWRTYCASTRVNDRSVGGFLRHLFVVQRTRPEDPGVRIMTTHRAKGLEFRAVAVVGLYQGGFPDWRSFKGDPEALAEERRAFYVSVTRASRALHLTWPERRVTRYGNIQYNERSQFIEEAGL